MADFLDGLRSAASAALFPLSGELTASGLQAPVEVLRDRYGVAYLSADSLEDLWFAQGFVTAGERLFQLDLALKQANGRLSELFGELTIEDDRFTRTVGINRAGARIAAGWDDTSRAMIARFREGVHAWIAAMPAPPVEYVLLDAQPDVPDDDASWGACWAMFSWALSGNWDLELVRVHLAAELGEETAGRLLPPLSGHPTAPAAGRLAGELLQNLPRPPRGQGSNEWAVAGARTASGQPLLANDPHLLVQQPGAWIELHLRAPGYEARGVAAPFTPGIVLGTTAHHAWGATNVCGDVQDLYLERLNDDGTAARYEDRWEPLTIHREEIGIRGSEEPIVHEVRATRHGPLLDSYLTGRLRPAKQPLDGTYALRWVGAEHSIRPSALIDVANVTSFEGFREAARALECPGQNLVYADVDGTIGYQCTGLHPIRTAGDGTTPGPRMDGRARVGGLRPLRGTALRGRSRPGIPRDGERPDPRRGIPAPDRPGLPCARSRRPDHRAPRGAVGPHRGDVSTDPIRHRLDLGARPRPADPDRQGRRPGAPRWVGPRSHRGFGGRRLLGGPGRRARSPGRRRQGAPRGRVPVRPRAVPVSRAPEICSTRAASPRSGSTTPSMRPGVAASTRWARTPRPGAGVTSIGRGSPTRSAGCPASSRCSSRPEHPLGGDEQTVNNAGFEGDGPFAVYVVPSWRVVYDLSDLDASRGILPTGQSGNPASPHWNDQTEAWAAGDLRPLPFTRAAVEEAATERLALVPA